jgi:TRAP-type mannitol/chloroaromatic compound transport system permease small subunit
MDVNRLLRTVDRISIVSGKFFAWLIVALMLVVCIEVFKRYILNAPTAWVFDVTCMLYGGLFMLCGAYTLAQNGHVRGDFLYGSMKPRLQASFDLALYFLFFLPGIVALIYAGYGFAYESWSINEHVVTTADGPTVYQFKAIIPIAGSMVLLQGLAEIVRCVMCLKTGEWPDREKDVEEIDVVGEQLAQSEFVDDSSREMVMQHIHEIEDAAKHRSGETA